MIEPLDHICDVIAVIVFVVISEHPLDFFYGCCIVTVILLATLVADEDWQRALLFVAEEVGTLVVALADVGTLEDAVAGEGVGLAQADVAVFLHFIL